MQLAIVGRIRKAQGIRGELLVEPVTDAPDVLFASGRRVFVGGTAGDDPASDKVLTVERTRPFKESLLIVKFGEIRDRTEAEAWNNRYLFAPAEELVAPAEDEVFVHELFGLDAESVGGEKLGRIEDVLELPQGLVLAIQGERGEPVLVPYTPEIVVEVRLSERKVLIAPVPGMFD